MNAIPLNDDAKRKITKLLESQLIAVLSTTSDDEPYSCLVGFGYTPDLNHIFFATIRARLKYRKMKANPVVSLIVDTRSNSPNDFHEAISITFTGTVTDVKGPERGILAGDLAKRHPALTDFVNQPDCAIMLVKLTRIYLVENFESTSIYAINSTS
jgi:nitroimidazol reductase NimA-like FMN-containing flavoprotein (pyridoxamine 5'-phosphate oxidase superfamily)